MYRLIVCELKNDNNYVNLLISCVDEGKLFSFLSCRREKYIFGCFVFWVVVRNIWEGVCDSVLGYRIYILNTR